jgi:hypothetical protein
MNIESTQRTAEVNRSRKLKQKSTKLSRRAKLEILLGHALDDDQADRRNLTGFDRPQFTGLR